MGAALGLGKQPLSQVLGAIFLEFKMWINKVSHYIIIIAFYIRGAFMFCCC